MELRLTALLGLEPGLPGLPHLPGNLHNMFGATSTFFNTSGGLPPAFVALYNLAGQGQLGLLSQVTGEGGSSLSQSSFMAMGQFFSAMFDPFAQGRNGSGATAYAAEPGAQARAAFASLVTKAPAYQPFERRWGVWGAGYGGTATVGGDATVGSADATHRAYGFAVGADRFVSSDTRVGFALAGGGTRFGLAQGLGSGRSDLFQAGVHARHQFGAAYLAGALAYSWQDVRTERNVTFAGERLEADFRANTLAGRAEAGWRYGSAFAGVTPYAALQVTSVRLPGYAERATAGAGIFALSYASRTDTQTRTELGARFDHAVAVESGELVLRGRAAWAHDFGGSVRAANAAFQALPGASFTVQGARPDRNALLAGAGAEIRFDNGLSVGGTFEGEFSRNLASYAGRGTVRYRR